MKIISMNIRGIKGSIKRRYVSTLISNEQVDMVCIQETKCSELNKESVFQLWGSNEIEWVENGANNSARGLITMWRKSCFQLSSFCNGRNFTIIQGLWKAGTDVFVTIVNVYSSGSLGDKKAVWEEISNSRFKVILKEKWLNYEVQGGGIFIFKEKLKKLKADLNVWNKKVFGDVNQAGVGLQTRLRELDAKDDELDLNEQEREEKRSLLIELNKNLFNQEAIAKQKARQNWLKKGDLNTKFFHSLVKWRRGKNEIHGVLENGWWCEDKDEVKDKVRDFFEARFFENE